MTCKIVNNSVKKTIHQREKNIKDALGYPRSKRKNIIPCERQVTNNKLASENGVKRN